MGVYIKNMKMPKEDEEIIIRIDPWGTVMTEYALPIAGAKAVPVPEPHGRLGDLDRLEQMFIDIDNAPYSGFDGTEPFYSAEDAAQIIRLAPTVIQANTEEEKMK